MKVYHGSDMEITKIDLSKCQLNKDFGRAFYVIKFRYQAEYWAKRKGKTQNHKGYITEYIFYENAFEHYGLKVLRFDGYTEEWLDFVVMNRDPKSPIPTHDYDIVEGPVADDDITQRIRAYLNGSISKAEFIEELKFKHTPSHQIAFCTVESLQMLELAIETPELELLNIDDAITQSLVNEYGMTEIKAIDTYFESGTYQLLIDEDTKLYEKPWQEIYIMLKKELKK